DIRAWPHPDVLKSSFCEIHSKGAADVSRASPVRGDWLRGGHTVGIRSSTVLSTVADAPPRTRTTFAEKPATPSATRTRVQGAHSSKGAFRGSAYRRRTDRRKP